MTVAELKEMIDTNDWDIKYSRFGIRIQEQPFKLGAMDHNSKVWIDEEETDEELDGVCAIDLNAPEAAEALNGNGYFGSYIALIASDSYEYGFDAGEVILKDAEVLFIIK
ncbi:hypothetical protein BN3589_03930 [Clostridium sp. C105KSO14]|nr:hypothetical protein BN3589_03930 [Clostridium sp. C105KSO14]